MNNGESISDELERSANGALPAGTGRLRGCPHDMGDAGLTETEQQGYLAPKESNGPRCLVVMHHYVHDRESFPRPGLPSIPPGIGGLSTGEFCGQLDRLCEVMEPVDWPRLYGWMCGRQSIPDRCFLLTFDDGLADHAENVVPILQERGLHGLFFVPGAVLTSRRLLSAHAVHLLLAMLDEYTLEREVHDLLPVLGGNRTDWNAFADLADAQKLYHYEPPARARLKYLLTMVLPIDLRDAVVEAIFERHIGSQARWAGHWYLGWDDLVGLQSSGHTIGGHGYNHEPYTRFTPAQRREDLRRVADVLRNGLGPDIRPFSYPYGRFDDDTCYACRGAGFMHAFTTESRCVIRNDDVLRLPRVDTIDVEVALEKEVACRS